MRTSALISWLLAATILIPVSAHSQEEKDWNFELAPFYLWAISIDGDIGIRNRTATASISFDEVWSNLQGVVTFRFGAFYNKKIGFLIDYNYLDLGTERVTAISNTEFSSTSQILNLAGAYRLHDGRHILDGIAGIRYTSLESRINFNNLGTRLDGDENWVDPLIGLRYSFALSDQWAIRLYGDIGGFGAASDLTWQGLGLISYQPWRNVALVAGYRAIYTDYETGSGVDRFAYEATIHGPVIGLDIRW